jgi:DNA-binding PadR family transcriptional regulator
MRHGWRHGHHGGNHHHNLREHFRAWRDHAEQVMAARGYGRGDDDGDDEGGGPRFGRGGPGGRGGWGRGGGPGGRLLGHGDLKLLLLALISEKPRHGYDLIKGVGEKFAGAYSPSPGAVYPLLTMLEEQDLIRSTAEGSKKLYAVTPEGEAFLKENEAAVSGILTRIDMAAASYSSHTAPEAVWEAWKTLKQAMNLPRAPWTEEEANRIRSILEKAARDIVNPGKN